MKCCFCGQETKYGNDAWPVIKGRCCDICNIMFVYTARAKMLKEDVVASVDNPPDEKTDG